MSACFRRYGHVQHALRLKERVYAFKAGELRYPSRCHVGKA